jgi:hypothetical protein
LLYYIFLIKVKVYKGFWSAAKAIKNNILIVKA